MGGLPAAHASPAGVAAHGEGGCVSQILIQVCSLKVVRPAVLNFVEEKYPLAYFILPRANKND